MQDSSSGRQPVWKNRAAPRLRKGLLPRSECDPYVFEGSGWVPSLEDSVVSPASLLFLLESLSHAQLVSYCHTAGKRKCPGKQASGLGPASTLGSWPQKLAGFSVEGRVGRPGRALGRGLRVYCVGSVRLVVVVVCFNWGLGCFSRVRYAGRVFNNLFATFPSSSVPFFRSSRITSLRCLRITLPVLKSTHKE